jgi:hypothetical protein
MSYSELTAFGQVGTKEVVGEDGNTYELEIQAFWDSKKDADVRLIVAADDGGWKAFKPLTGDFIMRPDGSLVTNCCNQPISPACADVQRGLC